VERVRRVRDELLFTATIAVGRLQWVDAAWREIVAGVRLGISLTAVPRYARNGGHLADWRMVDVTACSRGANQEARVRDVWEERRSSSVRLRYDVQHPREIRTHLSANVSRYRRRWSRPFYDVAVEPRRR